MSSGGGSTSGNSGVWQQQRAAATAIITCVRPFLETSCITTSKNPSSKNQQSSILELSLGLYHCYVAGEDSEVAFHDLCLLRAIKSPPSQNIFPLSRRFRVPTGWTSRVWRFRRGSRGRTVALPRPRSVVQPAPPPPGALCDVGVFAVQSRPLEFWELICYSVT